VQFFFDRLFANGKDVRALAGSKIAAVGQATADALRARGLVPDVMPERFISTELLPLLPEDQRGLRIAVVRAAEGRDELLDELRRRGGAVDLVVAYRTVAADYDLDELRTLIANDSIDAVTFTSASTVDHFFAKLTEDERTRVLQRAKLVSIGAATSEAIARYGRGPDLVAPKATVQSMHDALAQRA
jgi:uroporphyrinogen III methyltransferase/synthase